MIVNKIPRILCCTPYTFIFHFIRPFFKSSKVNIWYRNSLYFNNITPGMSDIDTDLFFAKRTTLKTQKSILKRFLILKYFIPLFSEVNIYNEDTIDFINDCINPLELQRDPHLIEIINSQPRIPSNEEKLTYIIKMLYADKNNLLFRPKLRKKKWYFHLKQLGIDEKVKPFDLDGILNILEKHLFVHFPQISIKKTLEQILKKKEMPSSFSSFQEKKDCFLLFPNKLIPHIIFSNSCSHDFFSKLSKKEQTLYIEQLKWELWGLYTQYKMIKDTISLKTHLNNLAQTIDYLDKEFSLIKDKFYFLIDIINKWEKSSNHDNKENKEDMC